MVPSFKDVCVRYSKNKTWSCLSVPRATRHFESEVRFPSSMAQPHAQALQDKYKTTPTCQILLVAAAKVLVYKSRQRTTNTARTCCARLLRHKCTLAKNGKDCAHQQPLRLGLFFAPCRKGTALWDNPSKSSQEPRAGEEEDSDQNICHGSSVRCQAN